MRSEATRKIPTIRSETAPNTQKASLGLEVSLEKFQSPSRRLSDSVALAVVCGVAALLRILPQVVAYPNPIGYDVVNYYIPMTVNIDSHWQQIANQFPFYAIILHSLSVVTGWTPQFVVPFLATVVFCAFTASVYALARKSFALQPKHAVFLTLFVAFQAPVLRTTWDLHRDMLALTGVVGAFAFLNSRNVSRPSLAFCVLGAVSDRMVGIFLVASLLIQGLLQKQKPPLVQAAISAAILVAISGSWVVTPLSLITSDTLHAQQSSPSNYTPANLSVLLLVMDGLLILPAAYGLLKLKRNPVARGALVALAGSLTWVILPNHTELGADRWIVLLGIWLSISAGYGIVSYGQSLRLRVGKMLLPASLCAFVILGIGYAVSPYEHPLFLFGLAKDYYSTFSPPTMQFSVLDTKQTGALIDSIKSVNLQTEANSVIIGSKDWRGFMELYLLDGRQYLFSDDPLGDICDIANSSQSTYLFTFQGTHANIVPSTALCGL